MKAALPLVLSAALVACGSAQVRGGRVVASGAQPAGKVVGSWVVGACVDAEGRPVPSAEGSVVRRVRVDPEKTVLVEALAGHDSLVVESSFSEGSERVYQAVLDPSSGPEQLRDFRVPRRGGAGRMAVVQRWEEKETAAGGFRAVFGPPLVACALSSLATEP